MVQKIRYTKSNCDNVSSLNYINCRIIASKHKWKYLDVEVGCQCLFLNLFVAQFVTTFYFFRTCCVQYNGAKKCWIAG